MPQPQKDVSKYACLAMFGMALGAQSLPVGDPVEDYLRMLSALGQGPQVSFNVRPLPLRGLDQIESLEVANPWRERLNQRKVAQHGWMDVELTDPQMTIYENTKYPWGQNDGAVWQGRGLTTAISVGGIFHFGPLTIKAQPRLIWNQNQGFPLSPLTRTDRSPFADPWRPGYGSSIDHPQRFGATSFSTLDPGQSAIQLDLGGASMGLSTESLWWGPGVRNAIVMSNNAGGFPHAFLGTSQPANIGVGRLEAQWIWGRLQQSDYFAAEGVNSQRFLTGIVMDFAPKAAPDFHLGLTRMYYENTPKAGLSTRDYLLVFQAVVKKDLVSADNPSGNDRRDQLLSLFWRWVQPASGFECYGEWARNDHNADMRDFQLEPDHSQGYTLGLQKVWPGPGSRLMRLQVETTNLERGTTQLVRATPSFYAHHIVLQGFTQRGQVIGAGIGPGGSSHYLGLDLFTAQGKVGAFFQRTSRDNDVYYTLSAPLNDYTRHDVQYSVGAQCERFYRSFDLGGSLTLVKEYNRDYVYRNDHMNVNATLSLRWHLP